MKLQLSLGTLVGVLAAAATATAQVNALRSLNSDPLDFHKVKIIDEVSVPAEEAGVLNELHVREGMLVEKGALLGEIDNTDAVLTVSMANYEYAAAKKTAENTLSIQAASKSREVAEAEYDAAVEANRVFDGVITETEMRRKKLQEERGAMQAQLAIHEQQVAKLDAMVKLKQLKRAEASLKRRRIVSRINGVVVELNKHAGDWVNPGETVMRIVRMDRLRIEGNINGRRYARHEVIGRPVDIEIQLTGGGIEKMEGQIVFASPLVESNEYTIRAEVNNRKVNGRWLLTPGLDAKVRLRDQPASQLSKIQR